QQWRFYTFSLPPLILLDQVIHANDLPTNKKDTKRALGSFSVLQLAGRTIFYKIALINGEKIKFTK
ncbi:hypothetical protein P9850_18690, partial [Anoxybacillus rupiensis]|nr:hypothetical protein [Anoxybacillus rupiensis]